MMKDIVLVVLGFMCMAAGPVGAWEDDVDAYVASLNRPDVQQALGLKAVRRPEGIVNRLDVTFADNVTPSARSRSLRTIGHEFLHALFQWRQIPMASVVERNAAGAIVDRVSVTLEGGVPTNPQTLVGSRNPC